MFRITQHQVTGHREHLTDVIRFRLKNVNCYLQNEVTRGND